MIFSFTLHLASGVCFWVKFNIACHYNVYTPFKTTISFKTINKVRQVLNWRPALEKLRRVVVRMGLLRRLDKVYNQQVLLQI